MKNVKIEQFSFKIQWFFEKKAREPREPEIFRNFRFCGMCVGFAICFAICAVIFLHFLQKYRWVPKIGFSADISIDIFIDIFIDISYSIFLLYFLIVFYYCILLLYFLVVFSCYLIVFSYCIVRREGRKEEGRKEGRREGVGFTLKSNNPNQTGGEQWNIWRKKRRNKTEKRLDS